MSHERSGRAFLLCVALAATFFLPGAYGQEVFVAEKDREALEILAPMDEQSFVLGPWHLTSVQIGPECALRLHLSFGDLVAVAVLTPRGPAATGHGIGVALEAGGLSSEQRDDLAKRLSSHLAPWGERPFFASLCATPGAAATRFETEHSDEPSLAQFRLRLLGWLSLLALAAGLLVAARRSLVGPPFDGNDLAPAGRGLRIATVLLAVAAAGVRLPLFFAAGPDNCESGPLYIGWHEPLRLAFLFPERVSSAHWIPYLHPPLHPALVAAWSHVCELFGVGGDVSWLRLPNALLAALMVLLLVRTGRVLGLPRSGVAAAALFVFAPATLRLSIMQENYVVEAVAVAWFLERLATLVVLRRPVLVGLTVAGAGTLLLGIVSTPIVGLGLLVLAGFLVPRGHAKALLGVVVFFAVACSPVFVGAFLATHVFAALTPPPDPGAPPLPLPPVTLLMLPALGASALLALGRWRLGLFSTAVVLAYVGLPFVVGVRPCNVAGSLAVVLFLPFAAVEEFGLRLAPRWTTLAVGAVVALTLGPMYRGFPSSPSKVTWVLHFSGLEGEVGTFLDRSAFCDVLEHDLPPGAPVLVVGNVPPISFYARCESFASADDLLRFSSRRSEDIPGCPLEVVDLSGRVLAVATPDLANLQDAESTPPTRPLGDLGTTSPWRDAPFLLLVASQVPSAWATGVYASLQADGLSCRVVSGAGIAGFEARRCQREPGISD